MLRKYKGFLLKTKPWKHQLAALQYLSKRNAAALYTDCGSGKSKVMLDLIVNKGFKRVLIVCTNRACQNGVWETQVALHTDIPSTMVCNVAGLSTGKKVSVLSKKLTANVYGQMPDIVVCNYEGVWRKPFDKLLLKANFDCIICDESHRIKSPSGKCSMFLKNLGAKVPNRYLVTGTPLAEDPRDVYAQYRFLDPSIFGTSYSAFKAQYENVDVARTARAGYTILDKKQPYKNLEDLREKMFSCAFKVDSDVKLPPVTKLYTTFQMSTKCAAKYQELTKEGALCVGEEFLTVENILTMTLRQQQMTSGFIQVENDEGERRLKRVSKARIATLFNILEDIPKNEPVVVFAKFKKDLQAIRQASAELGRSYAELSGSEDTYQQWKKGARTVLGVQYTAGSESVDFTRARYCIYYSLTHSLALYEQSLKRCHRPGQTRPVTYIHIIAKAKFRTVDEDIMLCLKEKKRYVEYIMSKQKSP